MVSCLSGLKTVGKDGFPKFLEEGLGEGVPTAIFTYIGTKL